ncbi:NADH dehydrogenase (ubiquinone) SGDH subunit isoform X2 [Nomia melanderi]|uniref:NADH dehydrogenase (ubiquinone) SGDH subunit isoform X2 n=2 Tax=Nomia melanderi TaxID=2448451 RepID=UPI0013043752|nr:NADH dehydrogenase [ubiquinone] 1 beta subcomplex subunit 5, mitochondrial isoform X2 [Nomia melanderi]
MFKMATWSKVLLSAGQNFIKNNGLLRKTVPNYGVINRMAHDRKMVIEPTRWQWHKTKDWFHFYFFVAAIPLTLIISYCNIFIGPATLEPIPEGYIPKHWEYFKSPITRWLARYVYPQPQMLYEQSIDVLVRQEERRALKVLQARIEDYIKEYQNYPLFSYTKSMYARDIVEYRKLRENV